MPIYPFRPPLSPLQAAAISSPLRGGGVSQLSKLETALGLEVNHMWAGELEDIGRDASGSDMTLFGTATAGNAATGLAAGNGITDKMFTLPGASTDGVKCADATVAQLDGTSTVIMAVIKGATGQSASRSVWGNRQTSSPFIGIEYTTVGTDSIGSRVSDDSSSQSDSIGYDMFDDAWHVSGILVDENANDWHQGAEGIDGGSEILPPGNTDSGTPLSLGRGRIAPATFDCCLLVVIRGAQVEGLNIGTVCQTLLDAVT